MSSHDGNVTLLKPFSGMLTCLWRIITLRTKDSIRKLGRGLSDPYEKLAKKKTGMWSSKTQVGADGSRQEGSYSTTNEASRCDRRCEHLGGGYLSVLEEFES